MKTINNTMLLAYSSASKGAKRLAKALGIKRINRSSEESTFNPNDGELVINWGNSSSNLGEHTKRIKNWINSPKAVDNTIDKTVCFNTLKDADVPTPMFFTKPSEAMMYLEDGEGNTSLVARQEVRGMAGKGIVYVNKVAQFVRAPLYTAFFPHECEVRVHVAFGNVIEFHDKTAHGFQGTHTGKRYTLSPADQAMERHC